ncbi:MAG: type I methionyl aminopeptidase [bacterium]|nr:type I methionyl aminopeptidase [bacterium]
MIKLKTGRDIEMIAESGRILAEVLEKISREARVGVALDSLENSARRLIKTAGAKPAFLGYRPSSSDKPFPAALCLSLNEQVVHGLPSPYKLRSGDLLKIDLGVDYKGYISDAAVSLGIGKISLVAQKLIEAVKKSLEAAVNEARPGKYLGDLGYVIETIIKKSGFSVIKGLTGHGVGFKLHEDPTIFNYGNKGEGLALKSGMVLAIEPMACLGKERIVQRSDDSFATADGSLTAHFEHTVAITENGPRILTL